MDMSLFIATWYIPGVIKERRELKTKEGKVFKHILKIAATGETYEVEVKPEVYMRFGEGQTVFCRGTFEFYNGKAQFVATEVTDKLPDQKKAA